MEAKGILGNSGLGSDTIYWISLTIAQLLLVLCCFSVLPHYSYIPYHYNTDYLYLSSLYTDLFQDGGKIGSWCLTPSPYFFPDMVLYFPIHAIFQNIGVSAIVFGFIQLWLIGFFFYQILKVWVDKTNANRYFLYAFISLHLFLLVSACLGENYMAHLLLSQSAHVGATLCSLISIFFYAKYLKTNQYQWLIYLSVIIIISVLSDRIFLVQTSAVLIFVSGYFTFKNKNWKPFVLITFSTFLGWLSFKLVREWITAIPEDVNPGLSVSKSIQNYLEDLRVVKNLSPAMGWLMILQPIILFLLMIGGWVVPKEKRTIYFLLLLSAAIGFLSPILLGFIQGIDTFRYLVHSYIVVYMLAAVFPALVIKSKYLRVSPWVSNLLILLVVTLISFFKLDKNKLNTFIHYKSSYVQLVESNQLLLKNGISNYWHTKEIYLMGGKRIRVVPLYPEQLTPFKWQLNKKWFTGNPENPPIFNFSINMRADKILGPPIDSIYGEKDTLFIYNDFHFKKVGKRDIRMFPLNSAQ